MRYYVVYRPNESDIVPTSISYSLEIVNAGVVTTRGTISDMALWLLRHAQEQGISMNDKIIDGDRLISVRQFINQYLD